MSQDTTFGADADDWEKAMRPTPWTLSQMEFLLGFGVPLFVMVVNVFIKGVIFGRSVDTVGADLALCGFSVLAGQVFRAMHRGILAGDVGVITFLVLFAVLVSWLVTHQLVKDRPQRPTLRAASSWLLGGLTLYICMLYWDLLRNLGYIIQ